MYTRKTARGTALALVALVVGSATLEAAAQNTNTVYGYGNGGTVFDLTVPGLPAQAGVPGPINLGSWGGSEAHFAAASGSSLTLRTLVAASGTEYNPSATSSFGWNIPVLAGTSGLSPGDAIMVTVSFHIDGLNATGFASAFGGGGGGLSDFTLESRAGSLLRLDVYDLDSPDYEGGSPQARLDFSAGVSLNSSSASYAGGIPYTAASQFLQIHLTDATRYNEAWAGNVVSGTNVPAAFSSSTSFDVDTGMLSLSFPSLVGNMLHYEGSLRTTLYCASYSGNGSAPACAGLSDYSNTFDAELSANVAGVSFGDYTPGVMDPVPEPASWLLMLAGAAVLLQRLRGGTVRS